MQITFDGVVVRAPLHVSEGTIFRFVKQHEAWAKRHIEKLEERRRAAGILPPITADDIELLAKKARIFIPERVKFYADRLGVNYGRITIRNQRTRWGSCSSKGNLNFNCLLMLTPSEVIDSVVVHELCHIKYMDHSDKFYREVLGVYPEYRKWDRWLKENGKIILMRVTDK